MSRSRLPLARSASDEDEARPRQKERALDRALDQQAAAAGITAASQPKLTAF